MMRQMMERVVLSGSGTRAKLVGYTSAGKTGSAQIFDRATRRYTHIYNASFLGFAPVGNPQAVVVVTLNGAKEYGGTSAAPVFRQIATAVLRVRQVTPDVPAVEVAAEPDRPLASRAAAPMLPEPAPGRAAQPKAAAPPAPAATAAVVSPPAGRGLVVGPRVPDFQGKSLSEVMAQSVASGVPVEVEGRGLVRAQNLPPGYIVAVGERVRLSLAR
jgi:cell division protein FtsI (penicillin-binding protein 3)